MYTIDISRINDIITIIETINKSIKCTTISLLNYDKFEIDYSVIDSHIYLNCFGFNNGVVTFQQSFKSEKVEKVINPICDGYNKHLIADYGMYQTFVFWKN